MKLCFYLVEAAFVDFDLIFRIVHSFVLCSGNLNELIRFSEFGNLRKFVVMTSNRLHERSQIRPRDTEYERPVIVRIEITVGQDE